MQTGEGSEEIVQAHSEKAQIESSLQEHKESAHKSLEMYRSITDKCKNHRVRKQGQSNVWRRTNLGCTQVFIYPCVKC